MGRPKGFTRADALDTAMRLFWEHGFERTSTRQLVEALGINRNSMYMEFGTKQGLFEACLEHYEHTWIDRNFGPLEAEDADPGRIRALFDHYAEVARRRDGLGCFFCNTAAEATSMHPDTQAITQRFFGRVQAALEHALRQGIAAGSIPRDVVPEDHSAFLLSSWLGLLMLIRANADEVLTDRVVQAAKAHVDRLEGRA